MSGEMKLSDWKKIYRITLEDDCAALSGYKGTETEVVVPSFVGEYKVTKIGKRAFAKKPVTKVILPETVVEVGESAFEGCAKLTEVILPDCVESIGEYAFSFSGLKQIRIPAGMTKTGAYICHICRDLEQIILPDGVQEISGGAFMGCSSLGELHLPSGLQVIGDHAFGGCESLAVIDIPQTVKQIGEQAFSGLRKAKKIILRGKPKIGKLAFSFSYDRENPFFQSNVQRLEVQAADSIAIYPYLMAWDKAHPNAVCSILRSAVVGGTPIRQADLLWLGKKVISGTKQLLPAFCRNLTGKELEFFESCGLITAKNGDILMELIQEDVTLKTQLLEYINKNVTDQKREELSEKKLDAAANRVAKQYKALEKAVRDFSQKTPRQIAEEWRTYKQGDGLLLVEYLGDSTEIVIPGFIGNEPVVGIAADAMRASCPEHVDQKSDYNKKMGKIKAVILSEGIRVLEENVFAGCIYMTNAVLPKSMEHIARNAFANCRKLTIHAPSGSFAEDYANAANIPCADDNGMAKAVGDLCGKNSLTPVEMPAETKPRSFAQWRQIYKFSSENGGITITGYKSKDPMVEIPAVIGKNPVIEIGCCAFEGNSAVRHVVIQNGVTEISWSAFLDCKKLQTVELPDSLTQIGRIAFCNCSALTKIRISKGTRIIADGAFANCPQLTIHAPAGSYAETYAKEQGIPFVAE